MKNYDRITPLGLKNSKNDIGKYKRIDNKISFIDQQNERLRDFINTLELMKQKVFENN